MTNTLDFYDYVSAKWLILPGGWRVIEHGDLQSPSGEVFGISGPQGRWFVCDSYGRTKRGRFKSLINATATILDEKYLPQLA